ncbi:hypothetical protein ABZ612_38410 [Streptomyces avermitilis]|uniref:hypothetical protein n=1 Tax=Streptomyces avermitilis TaxID=33903 RepID=UPI0033F3D6B1
MLPPSVIAGVSLVCALGPWLFTEPMVLRGLAAGAAVTAVVGAVVLRRWDTAAGKRVADLTRARASDEWRHEERVAELETDLEESRELRVKLEHKLRAKRAELAGLRNEHAALLRRYATAETERASALEGRRLLEIEATTPARALPAAPVRPQTPGASETQGRTETPGGSADSGAADAAVADAGVTGASETATVTESESTESTESVESVETEAAEAESDESVSPAASEVFSPSGSPLFLRANSALDALTKAEAAKKAAADDTAPASAGPATEASAPEADSVRDDDSIRADSVQGDSVQDAPVQESAPKDESPEDGAPKGEAPDAGPVQEAGQEDEAEGKTEAVDGHERAAAVPAPAVPAPAVPASAVPAPAVPAPAVPASAVPAPEEPEHSAVAAASTESHPAKAAKPAKPAKPAPSAQHSGHFTVPTAVAVVPASPRRRPMVEGGFDFFGTQKGTSAQALEAVQNEDLADVVGQEALALHKAEAESGFKPAGEGSQGVGQVIDLTAHDETEHIDVQELRIDVKELRSAVS